MKIRIKQGKRFVTVDVNNKWCRHKECFVPGFFTHHTAAGMSGISAWSDSQMSCIQRDNHGCPKKETL